MAMMYTEDISLERDIDNFKEFEVKPLIEQLQKKYDSIGKESTDYSPVYLQNAINALNNVMTVL